MTTTGKYTSVGFMLHTRPIRGASFFLVRDYYYFLLVCTH